MLSLFARLPRIHRALIILFTVLIAIALALPDPASLRQEKSVYEVGKAYSLNINPANLSADKPSSPLAQLSWQKFTVGAGESAAIVFQRAGLSSRLLYQLTTSGKEIKDQLTKLRPGDILEFGFDAENQLVQIKRPMSSYQAYVITKVGDDYQGEMQSKDIDYQYNYAEASITSNFWNAAISAGLNRQPNYGACGHFRLGYRLCARYS